MKSLEHFQAVYLYKCPVDMRKFRNGLCAIIQQEMCLSVFTNSLFIFTNRRGNIIRLLYWDDTGFAIWSKTLERDRYRWPKSLFKGGALEVSQEELGLILRGIDITSHKKLEYKNLF